MHGRKGARARPGPILDRNAGPCAILRPASLREEWPFAQDAEGLADAVGEHEAEILGIFRGIDGFRSYQIVKTGTASAISVTVCDAEASNRAARDYVAANLAHPTIAAPDVHVGAVAMAG